MKSNGAGMESQNVPPVGILNSGMWTIRTFRVILLAPGENGLRVLLLLLPLKDMSENKTSLAVAEWIRYDIDLSEFDCIQHCIDADVAKAIAEKYKRMEKALQDIEGQTYITYEQHDMISEALSFDPLSHE